MKFQKNRLAKKLGKAFRSKHLAEKTGAVILIQRAFKRKKAQREYLKHLESVMFEKHKKELDEVNSKAFLEKKRNAAKVILKHWRNYKKADKFSLAKTAQVAVRAEINASQGTVKIAKEQKCGLCKERLAIRFCNQCPKEDMQMFCIQCFKEFHARGARKRHMRMRIIYEG
jgi:hypothetical protein